MNQTFEQIFNKWRWKPIRNCPGRYVFADGASPLTVSEIAGSDLPVSEHSSETVPDQIIVRKFAGGGGMISYRKSADSYLHTLNDTEGFTRKLAQLGINI
jgi:hypothetical protein